MALRGRPSLCIDGLEVKTDFDSIVIGSGIGGLACAAALTKVSHKVLLFEQHSVARGPHADL